MNKSNVISVLIANYNYGKFIERSITSLINQTVEREKFEIIVVDDGSSDDSLEILSKFDGQLTLIKSEHLGLPEACNKGLNQCHGEYFIRLDSDDEFKEDFLENLLEIVENEKKFDFIIADRVERKNGFEKIVKIDLKNIYSFLSVGVLFKTEWVRKLGGYRNFYWEEHDLMLRYLREHPKGKHLKRPEYVYYRHNSNMTGLSSKRILGWKELLNEWKPSVLKKYGYDKELFEVIKNEDSI